MSRYAEDVAALVARLPEVYQPIYGHPELSHTVSRATEDRLEDIKGVYEAMSACLGRSLRVLDLGCAQGFISLSLAAMGASVVGVEMLPENAELCRKLGALNPGFEVDFIEGRIEDFATSLESDRFDIVLLLSVIHHVAFHVSPEVAESTVARVRSCVPVLLAELALADEPLYWASALPADPLEIFGSAEFVRELRQSGTHLSEVKRPLYFVSDHYWCAAGEVGLIQHVGHGGHRFAKLSFSTSRAYYLSSDRILKVLSTSGEDAEVNRMEVDREVEFLQGVGDDAAYPRVIGLDEDTQKLYLLREKLVGELLLDVIDSGEPYDCYFVIRDILEECIKLERRGLYHQDVRVWNVLRCDNGKFCLIDYGAISENKRDCFWPQNIYIAFLVFVKELLSAPRILAGPIREVGVLPYGFPGHLSFWVNSLAKRPLASWSFELMLADLEAAFLDPGAGVGAIEPETVVDALLKMLEEAVTALARSQVEFAENANKSHHAVVGRIEKEAQRISNVHHDLLDVSHIQGQLSEGQEVLSAVLPALLKGIEEQRVQGSELLAGQDVVLERIEGESQRISSVHDDLLGLSRTQGQLSDGQKALSATLSTLLKGVEEQRINGSELLNRLERLDKMQESLSSLAVAGREDSRALQLILDAMALRLDAIERGFSELEVKAGEQAARNMVLHSELTSEISEVKARVFRKGFWARLFGR